MCWKHCKGVYKLTKPRGSEVIGRWHRTTPKGRGDKRSVKQMIEERISEQERQQEWPITAWIKKVVMTFLPEPGAAVLLGVGILGMGGLYRARKN